MIAIVNYGMGNIRSVVNAIETAGRRCTIANEPGELESAERIILPGVGAFGEAMTRLRDQGWIEPLLREVMAGGKPLLGICLGMQLLADRSFEHGEHAGLGWISGEVQRIDAGESQLRVPHMGWNSVRIAGETTLFRDTPQDTSYYFVHSYHFVPCHVGASTAVTDYGKPLVAAVEQGHVFGTQFHPEKSHDAGLLLLKNFCAYRAC